MSKPLIDVDELIDAYWSGTHEDAKDRVMEYLRSVLTPEALSDHENQLDLFGTTGEALYRRIFGEEGV